jgi:hypothetical protein
MGDVYFQSPVEFRVVTAVFGLRRGILDPPLFNMIKFLISSLGTVLLEKKFLGLRAIFFLRPEFEGPEGVAVMKGSFPAFLHSENRRE